MQTEKDYSYGVIPVIKVGDSWKVFLINQYGSVDDVYWTFPKGHKEIGETDEAAARRELAEETNITLRTLHTEHQYEQGYTFLAGDRLIDKKVIYFLGIAESETFSIQDAEVKEAGWFSLEDAREQVSYDQAKAVLDEVTKTLKRIKI